jgi:BirA family biotin operon repressor/biotin-[acetyl-CoA-carboxylase] ligase
MNGKSLSKSERRAIIKLPCVCMQNSFLLGHHFFSIISNIPKHNFIGMHAIDHTIVCPSRSHFPRELKQLLRTLFIAKIIHFYKEVESTQDLAIAIVEKKLEDAHGTVIIAERQKNGKGRINRKWISPRGGVWLSVIFKPKIKAAQATLLPIVAALAVCDTINQKTKLDSKIKWPNDIVIEGKKVSGTLVDISIDSKNIEYAVLGIGINANVDVTNIKRYIDTNSRKRALEMTSLKKELSGKKVNIIDLSRILLEKLEYYYLQLEKHYSKRIIQKCRQRSETLNNLVVVEQQNESFECKAIDIDSDGALIVKKSDNNILRIVVGDALVRRK